MITMIQKNPRTACLVFFTLGFVTADIFQQHLANRVFNDPSFQQISEPITLPGVPKAVMNDLNKFSSDIPSMPLLSPRRLKFHDAMLHANRCSGNSILDAAMRELPCASPELQSL